MQLKYAVGLLALTFAFSTAAEIYRWAFHRLTRCVAAHNILKRRYRSFDGLRLYSCWRC
jgi:hypothetical protein